MDYDPRVVREALARLGDVHQQQRIQALTLEIIECSEGGVNPGEFQAAVELVLAYYMVTMFGGGDLEFAYRAHCDNLKVILEDLIERRPGETKSILVPGR